MQCTCGAKLKRPWSPGHLHSPLHRSSTRLKALLATNCLTFAEIGHRLGLTRERVRQLANQLGYKGRVRQATCSLTRSIHDASEQPLTKALRATLPDSYQLTPVRTKAGKFPSSRFSRKILEINGTRCLLFRAHVSSKGFYQLPCCRPRTGIKWYIGKVEGSTDWIVLPLERLPRVGTMFAPHSPQRPAPVSRRPNFCNWRQYLNAWHMLSPEPVSQ